MEPFDTFRAEPRRFAVGLPLVFGGSFLAAALLLRVSFSLALAVLLAIQTGGFLALYVPALHRRSPTDDSVGGDSGRRSRGEGGGRAV
jgi:hypothetical protein